MYLPNLIEADLSDITGRQISLWFHHSNYRHMCKILITIIMNVKYSAVYFSTMSLKSSLLG